MANVLMLQSNKVDMPIQVFATLVYNMVIIKAENDRTPSAQEAETAFQIRLTKQEALALAQQLTTAAEKLRDPEQVPAPAI